MTRYLSGFQPSGKLHLGNYFGAIKPQLELQANGEAFYFLADYHALTSVKDAQVLRANVIETATTYLALHALLGPDKLTRVSMFRQSDIPEVTELAWILSNVVNVSVLQRSHAYKDKVDKGLPASVGLFTYPVLMAADILIFQSDIVPVGQDQIQHVEIACDIAQSFNHQYGEVFKIPKYSINAAAPKVLGLDGNKMSKSYNNTIPIFDDPKIIKKLVSQIKTDDKKFMEEPLTTYGELVLSLYRLVATPEETQEMVRRYIDDRTFGYGHAKQLLTQKLNEQFSDGPAGKLYQMLLDKPEEVEDILTIGASRARHVAKGTLRQVRKAVGLHDRADPGY